MYFLKTIKPWICWSITSWFSLLAWIFSMRSSSRLLFPLNNITLMLAHCTRGATDWGPLVRPRSGPPPWAPIGRGAGSPLPPLARPPRRATYCCQQWREIADSAGMNRFRSQFPDTSDPLLKRYQSSAIWGSLLPQQFRRLKPILVSGVIGDVDTTYKLVPLE